MPRAFVPSKRPTCILLMALVLPVLAQSSAGVPAKDDPSVSNSETMGRAAHSLLLDAVHTDAGYFVVGERGHILSSTDAQTWTQVKVPTRSTLTSIATAGGQLWAAGHDGVIVHSADQGRTWTRQRVSVWQAGSDDITLGDNFVVKNQVRVLLFIQNSTPSIPATSVPSLHLLKRVKKKVVP